jgi:hydroxyacylglutathione hydrolase
VILHQRFVPGLAIASYIIGDEATGEAVVIDPTRDVDDFVEFAREHDLHIRHIIETHVHADFVSGSAELRSRLEKEATIHASGLGGKDWTPPYADHVVASKDAFKIGKLEFKFHHTPGHTPEHICISLTDHSRSSEVPWVFFTGDFLFVGDVGRPDLLGPAEQQRLAHDLYGSVFGVLKEFPDFTEIFPGHGAGSLCGKAISSRRSSTIGYERRFSSSLQQKPEEEWVKNLLSGMPLAPPYFRRMKEVNRRGPALIGREFPGLRRWSAKDVYDRVCESCVILDVRSKEAFAGAQIPNAVNIPIGHNLPSWAGWVLPYDRPMLLILEHPDQVREVTTHLLRVGFDDVRGYLDGGINAWVESGYPVSTLKTLSVHDLNKQLQQENGTLVLDVRTEGEWRKGHIEGAHFIHGGKIRERFGELPKDKHIAVICGSGYRGSIAASFLKREGFSDVANVLGGMTAWNTAGYQITKE